MSEKKLTRSSNRMIAGICGGIAEYLNVDPTVVRLVTILIAFITGIIPLTLTYIISIFIIPDSKR
ncbi:PspC domain-containing protein [Coprobacter tertius]|uniref:PspC domain-containing protein n=1 Tax=Coprobacter tertius TaxID=2944915 RepID=A0ABT1MH04_9BACT|nr:PspC domain-containing protein [Coprobacter tertius]MCP9611900.1 PspC domain-containing protein [Coprobacter tertius]